MALGYLFPQLRLEESAEEGLFKSVSFPLSAGTKPTWENNLSF
jgi:hypothetical protein